MFGGLKDKLKKALSAFSKDVEEEAQIEEATEEEKEQAIKEEEEKSVEKAEAVVEEPGDEESSNADEIEKDEEPELDDEEIVEDEPEEVAEPEEIETQDEESAGSEPDVEDENTVEATPEEEDILEKTTSEEKEIVPEVSVEEKEEEAEPEEISKDEIAVEDTKEDSVEEETNQGDTQKEEVETRSTEKKSGFFSKIFSKKSKEDEPKADAKSEEVVESAVKEEAEVAIEADEEPKATSVDEKDEPNRLHAPEDESSEVVEKEATTKEKEPVAKPEKKGLFSSITDTFTKVKLSEDKFDNIFFDLEVVLLENNVALEVIEKIKEDMKQQLTTGKVSRTGIDGLILDALKDSIRDVVTTAPVDVVELVKDHRKKNPEDPYVITVVGINGSGKTTNLAKLGHKLKEAGLEVVFAAGDTFRAAAIQQLENHAKKLDIKLIKHDYGADAAAVAHDAISHAKSKGVDVVLIDTAGRLHSNTNLMDELSKVIRVANPDLKIFVGESITGNDCIEQLQNFNEAVGIDAIILTKADVDDKGGTFVSASYVSGKPIAYVGTGQTYDDLEPYDPEKVMSAIGLS